MKYQLVLDKTNFIISEPPKFYETDLVRQWFTLLPGTVLRALNSQKIIIMDTGRHNKNEGPDIQDALLFIDDKIVKGAVECHIYTSDWYKHQHHTNVAYDDVILHVVREVNFGSNITSIPTVVIKAQNILQNKCTLTNDNIAPNFEAIIDQKSAERWLTKVNSYVGIHEQTELLWKVLLKNSYNILGVGGNKEQFKVLADQINFTQINKHNFVDNEQYLHEIVQNTPIKWVSRGIRPAQQAPKRIKLAVELMEFYSNSNFNEIPNPQEISGILIKNCPSASGVRIRLELLGNILLPFWAARALYFQNIQKCNKYFNAWKLLKMPSSYGKFKRRFGNLLSNKQLKSFTISQGLIALDAKWCKPKLCQLCPLKRKNFGNR